MKENNDDDDENRKNEHEREREKERNLKELFRVYPLPLSRTTTDRFSLNILVEDASSNVESIQWEFHRSIDPNKNEKKIFHR